MKNVPFAMAADDIANSTVVTVLVGLLLELDLYLVNTDKQRDTVEECNVPEQLY